MILIFMPAILLVAGILCWFISKWNLSVARWIALIAIIADLILIANVWSTHSVSISDINQSWFIKYQANWIPSFGISFHLALDGLSVIMLVLTFFLGSLAVLCSWNEVKERHGFYYFNLLWTLAGITGVFLALDLFLFYFFWEVMLVPMYFLIAIWGDINRRYAAYKFFIFTQAGGLLMLVAILALYFIHGAQSGVYTYDYFSLLNTALAPEAGRWIMLGFMIAFLIKLPAVPFHNWLPDAHSEAPTAGSLILAGLLLKTGAYGIIRFVLPLFPQALPSFAWLAMLIGVIGIVYGAMMAYAQTDIKRLIAYTSVSHMGYVLLGIFAFKEIAMQGVVMQMITHGISTGALFILAGMLKERLHTRDINQMGGLWTAMPAMGSTALFFVMASLGLPVFGNFIAEFLILLGAFQSDIPLTVIATLGFVFSALYSLRLMQRVFLGPIAPQKKLYDLSIREYIMMAVLIISIVLLGIYPQPVMDLVNPVVIHLVGGQATVALH